jgi:hypothetical protein
MSEYEAAFVRLGRSRKHNLSFDPEHCFFSSVVISLPIPSSSHFEGARDPHLSVAGVNKHINCRGLFRTWFFEDADKQWPGHETDKLSALGVALSVTNDTWQNLYT